MVVCSIASGRRAAFRRSASSGSGWDSASATIMSEYTDKQTYPWSPPSCSVALLVSAGFRNSYPVPDKLNTCDTCSAPSFPAALTYYWRMTRDGAKQASAGTEITASPSPGHHHHVAPLPPSRHRLSEPEPIPEGHLLQGGVDPIPAGGHETASLGRRRSAAHRPGLLVHRGIHRHRRPLCHPADHGILYDGRAVPQPRDDDRWQPHRLRGGCTASLSSVPPSSCRRG
jgi:hypothetical protein